jgi:DegV family protein with EDD domain
LHNVAIVTDSNACLPVELIRQYHIEVVPLGFIHEGKVYRDGIDITPDEIYRILPQAKSLPTSSSPSPGDFFGALEKVAAKYSNILVITLSLKFSTMFASAKIAASMAKEKLRNVPIEVLDCGTAAGAQGLVVLAAAKAARAEGSLTKVTEVAKNVMSRVNLIAFLDTLYYLAKGGRVPKVIAWANSLVKIKPIFQIAPLSGEASIVKMVRTRPEAIKQLLEIVKEKVEAKPIHVIVMHSHSLAEAENLKERLVSHFLCDEIYISDFAPVMGIHTGPGVLGIAFYPDD